MILGRKGFLVLFIIGNALALYAQDAFLPKRVFALHVDKLISLDYPALHASYDLRFAQKDYASVEAGFIYDFDANIYKKEAWERGIIGYQMGLSYKKLVTVQRNSHILWGLKWVHQYTKRRIDDWVFRNQNTYEEKIFYRQQLKKYAYYFLVGNQWKINDKWLFSVILHLGWNHKIFKTDLPPDAEVIFDNSFIRINPDVENDGDYSFPEAYFELRVGRYF